MSESLSRVYNGVLHLAIVAFTASLVWFAFVYYPKVVANYQTGNFPQKALVPRAQALRSYQFPLETDAFRIVREESADAYYAFIAGSTLEQYLVNRDAARLALKTALSQENLCEINVIYVSAERLAIPQKFQKPDC